ncbi:MAG: hexokinase [Veillonellaceae bacterium]|jgi:hexokinase|nr:hexokinase [Veillonellaceae bacterium]
MLHDLFKLKLEQLQQLTADFATAMADGLAQKPSPLKMLPSYLSTPTGTERGTYLALDFGGTNIRVALIELYGNRRYAVVRNRQSPLRTNNYDYTAANVDAEKLFDYIAGEIAHIAPSNDIILLGHTFSFPSRQTYINEAVLISWTKELKTAGVENANVTDLLKDALKRRGLRNIRPAAVINDTVGTLLTSAYLNPDTDIGSICGTGHNTAYLESIHYSAPMIINMESGNFDKLPLTRYDKELDANSEKPGQQLLEKSVSGHYLGELLRLIIRDLIASKKLPIGESERLDIPYSITAQDLSLLIADIPIDLTSRLNVAEQAAIQQAAALLRTRSAQLAAATFYGVLRRVDPRLERRHHIAIDGSLYEKMPGYARAIQATLLALCGKSATNKMSAGLIKDGSGVGAAIAAAMCGE